MASGRLLPELGAFECICAHRTLHVADHLRAERRAVEFRQSDDFRLAEIPVEAVDLQAGEVAFPLLEGRAKLLLHDLGNLCFVRSGGGDLLADRLHHRWNDLRDGLAVLHRLQQFDDRLLLD
ncbi:hypothetical protein [Hankyongella ginsenosidimutans]|uniref:hypothetical protein n=1 Tax=Hankyongella ginsenosidimutans TaxID=1763828 RepID=UPI001CA37E47|nr:hypothetical protein [Hankyongella ginsenosidimutans]